MNESKAINLMLRGLLLEMPQENRDRVLECVEKIKAAVKEAGDEGVIALSMAATEMGDSLS